MLNFMWMTVFSHKNITVFLCFLCLWWSNFILAQTKELSNLEEVVILAPQILGNKLNVDKRTGSAYYISNKELRQQSYSDINRILKSVPGVNVYEEDGFGLRPNISMRGSSADRSSRIVIMEDGILAAPAPYAAPAAYYFPNVARMHSIEILKGSSQIQYGPFTTGGAINLVSTPIPKKLTAQMKLQYGLYNTLRGHAVLGNQHKYWGYMVEYLRYQSNGFKKLPSKENTGFHRDDIVGKIRVNTERVGTNHILELKVGYAAESSNETYVGISEEDFKNNPYIRYAGSALDNMKTRHYQGVLSHIMSTSENLQIITNIYANKFFRNWYKLNDIQPGSLGVSSKKHKIEEVLEAPEINQRYMDILRGSIDQEVNGLWLRANNRNYLSRGIQTKLKYKLNLEPIKLSLEAGLRYHQDEEDRFTWDDGYSIKNGKMLLRTPGIHGTQQNLIKSARAIANYYLANMEWDKLTLVLGLRYEDIILSDNDFGKNDIYRTGMRRIEQFNKVKVLIPSLGISYKIMPNLNIFSGVHRGFAPPGAKYRQKAESSINSELGIRFRQADLFVEIIGFYNYYFNMLSSDLAAAGGAGTGVQFAVGQAQVIGLEHILGYTIKIRDIGITVPLQFTYTYTGTRLANNFQSELWGQVKQGDVIPYVTPHSANLNLGITYKFLSVFAGLHYNSEVSVSPIPQNLIPIRLQIPANTILDLSIDGVINKHINLGLNFINLTNSKYLVSRHPAGLRPGHPLGAYVKLNLKL